MRQEYTLPYQLIHLAFLVPFLSFGAIYLIGGPRKYHLQLVANHLARQALIRTTILGTATLLTCYALTVLTVNVYGGVKETIIIPLGLALVVILAGTVICLSIIKARPGNIYLQIAFRLMGATFLIYAGTSFWLGMHTDAPNTIPCISHTLFYMATWLNSQALEQEAHSRTAYRLIQAIAIACVLGWPMVIAVDIHLFY